MNIATQRDETIELIVTNLVMAGALYENEVPDYMAMVTAYDDVTLGLTLVMARQVLDYYYSQLVKGGRN